LLKQASLQKKAEASWKPYSRLNQPDLSQLQLSWLLDASSLTQRLILASGGKFQVEVISEQWIKPMLSERNLLGMSHNMYGCYAKVSLACSRERLFLTVRCRGPLDVY